MSPSEGKDLLTASEQRRFRRYAVQFRCVVRPREGRRRPAHSEMGVETKDVSRGGLYFVAGTDWKIGTGIECLMELPPQIFGGRPVAIRCSGKIARLVPEPDGRIGVGATIDSFQFVPLEREFKKTSEKKVTSLPRKGKAKSIIVS
ncbi:MAG: PilZ domain-containing protein [Acidobacteria bacterium]|nr:PilZ domain-containing protein [Acidobacteriota bacterium]